MINVFGVRLWIFIMLIMSIILGLGCVAYYFREYIKQFYYRKKFPEKLIKVVIHYKNGQFKNFYRLIPDDNYFMINGLRYCYKHERVIKENDWFAIEKDKEHFVNVQGKEYKLEDMGIIRRSKTNDDEIHYFFGVPVPIIFNFSNKDIELSSKELNDFKENDLFAKLLTLETERSLLIFCLLVGIINWVCPVTCASQSASWRGVA